MTTPPETHLTTEQLARAEAARLASKILVADGVNGVEDLCTLAVFILDGAGAVPDFDLESAAKALDRAALGDTDPQPRGLLLAGDEAHAMVRAALEDVRERLVTEHAAGPVHRGESFSEFISRVIDEVRP